MAEAIAREARGEPPQSAYLTMLDRLRSDPTTGSKQQLQQQAPPAPRRPRAAPRRTAPPCTAPPRPAPRLVQRPASPPFAQRQKIQLNEHGAASEGRLLRPSSAYVRQRGDSSQSGIATARPPRIPSHIAALIERQQAQQAQREQQAQQAQTSGDDPEPAWVQLWHMCAQPEPRHALYPP